ncbi:MAG: helix-turn-helix transcriptional regulator [Bacteroidales bacterium]|nr:helix-turn-helix transcriptional regulator [Bacteroidales bacterium]
MIDKDIPGWLVNACRQMEKPENIKGGIPAFVKLSGKTQEHLTRTLKKHYHTTPSDFINTLRLSDASRLLRITFLPVSEIIYMTGFENPSYFYRQFKLKFGMSPKRFRQLNNSIVNR